MLDNNMMLDYIPSIAEREAIIKNNIKFTDKQWYIIIDNLGYLSKKNKIKIEKYIRDNTDDIKLSKYINIQLFIDKLYKPILHNFIGIIEKIFVKYMYDFEDIFEYVDIPCVFDKDDIVYCYSTKCIYTVWNSKEQFDSTKIRAKDKNDMFCPDYSDVQLSCLLGLIKVDEDDDIDYMDRHEHLNPLELDYLENIYKDRYTCAKSGIWKDDVN